MISSLLPGFAGSPADRWAEAEAVADRRPVEPDRTTIVGDAAGVRSVPRRDPRIRRPYAPEEIAEMDSIRSARYPGDDPDHHHGVPGARDSWEAAERLGTIAPVMGNPSLDPANGDLVAVSYMAGHGGKAMVGFDVL